MLIRKRTLTDRSTWDKFVNSQFAIHGTSRALRMPTNYFLIDGKFIPVNLEHIDSITLWNNYQRVPQKILLNRQRRINKQRRASSKETAANWLYSRRNFFFRETGKPWSEFTCVSFFTDWSSSHIETLAQNCVTPSSRLRFQSRDYRNVRFYGSFPGKSGWSRARVAQPRGGAEIVCGCGHGYGHSLFNGNYRTIVNVIRVTVPERMRMESGTYRGSTPVPRGSVSEEDGVTAVLWQPFCLYMCVRVGARWKREQRRETERRWEWEKREEGKGQAMTIARAAPTALFRLVLPVDISVSFCARKCERLLGVGVSVVTASITGKALTRGKRWYRWRGSGIGGKQRWSANPTTALRTCDRCFTNGFNGCSAWRVTLHGWKL